MPPLSTPTITSALELFTPSAYPMGLWPLDATLDYSTRAEAMTVPAVARARNLIASTIATLPRRLIVQRDGTRLTASTLLAQPDPSVAGSVTYAWTVDDLIFYGAAYWQVLAVYADTGRPLRARRIDPMRISYRTDKTGTLVEAWQIDGIACAPTGVGSMIAFQGLDEGVLRRAGRTIASAVQLEKAAKRYAEEALPSLVIRNSGPDLLPEDVNTLLANWKTARQSRATAYLGGNLTADIMGMDPAALQLVEARRHVATEIARLMGVPAYYLGAETNTMTYSNVTSERRALVDFSLRPFLTCIEERLSLGDVTSSGLRAEFDLDDFLRGNPDERANILSTLVGAGILTIAEARATEDLAPTGTAP